jgi:hypothetical protein
MLVQLEEHMTGSDELEPLCISAFSDKETASSLNPGRRLYQRQIIYNRKKAAFRGNREDK